MKFKSKEELTEYYCKKNIHIGTHKMIGEIFKSFVERKDFYKKYKNEPSLLEKDEPEIYKEWRRWLKNHQASMMLAWIDSPYKNWLFDYCFGDVVE